MNVAMEAAVDANQSEDTFHPAMYMKIETQLF
jgi:hypothetical protein